MHLRRFPILPIPARIVQFARLVAPNQRAAEVEMLTRLPGGRKGSGRHREARWSEHVRLSWEGHSEASTVTLTMTIPAGSPPGWDWPQALDWQEALALAAAMPGDVIRATHSLVVADDRDAASPVADAGFSPSHLVTSHMAGPARMWSDLRVDQEGYGRQVIAANGLDPADLARCVQRLQELGNYRNLALLGLLSSGSPVPPGSRGGVFPGPRRSDSHARLQQKGAERKRQESAVPNKVSFMHPSFFYSFFIAFHDEMGQNCTKLRSGR